MDNTQYAQVTEAIAGAILERERVRPTFLQSNPDNSFTAIFDDVPAPSVRADIAKADKTIVVLEPETIENRQPNVEVGINATVRFAFTEMPKIDLTD
ncbi:MAG: hypothetical protein WBC91_21340 [Phototrophicaceae bacterium]